MSDILLLLSGAGAAGFYGSIVSYQFFSRLLGEKRSIATGFSVGSVIGVAALTSLPKAFLDESWWGLHGAFMGAHFFSFIIWFAFLTRDRHRSGYYGTIGHAYLEATCDGVLIMNTPLACVFTWLIAELLKKLVHFVV